jgi:hypothetical protein
VLGNLCVSVSSLRAPHSVARALYYSLSHTVLKGIDTARSRGVRGQELQARVRELLKECLGNPTDDGFARKDQIGHHILRLAYSMSEENRRWFMQQEVALFRHRLERETPEQQQSLMERHGLTWTTVSDAERTDLAGPLKAAWDAMPWYGGSDGHGGGGGGVDDPESRKPDFAAVRFFKVPFIQVRARGASERKGPNVDLQLAGVGPLLRAVRRPWSS